MGDGEFDELLENWIRRVREDLQNNKPVMAFIKLEKIEEFRQRWSKTNDTTR